MAWARVESSSTLATAEILLPTVCFPGTGWNLASGRLEITASTDAVAPVSSFLWRLRICRATAPGTISSLRFLECLQTHMSVNLPCWPRIEKGENESTIGGDGGYILMISFDYHDQKNHPYTQRLCYEYSDLDTKVSAPLTRCLMGAGQTH